MAWKGISLSFLVDIQKGGAFFSWGKAIKSLFGNTVETLEGRDEWYATHDESTMYQSPLPGVEPDGYYEEGVLEKNGQPNDIPIQPIWRWYNIYAQDIAEEWIVDATNVRMREMVLGLEVVLAGYLTYVCWTGGDWMAQYRFIVPILPLGVR